jgi:hypothetical protein
MNNIELAYLIIFSVISLIAILTITRKMSMGIGLTAIGTGLIIAWILSPYSVIIMHPVGQALFYGGEWNISAILGIVHLASLVYITLVAFYNLLASGGKISWA